MTIFGPQVEFRFGEAGFHTAFECLANLLMLIFGEVLKGIGGRNLLCRLSTHLLEVAVPPQHPPGLGIDHVQNVGDRLHKGFEFRVGGGQIRHQPRFDSVGGFSSLVGFLQERVFDLQFLDLFLLGAVGGFRGILSAL